MTRQKMTERRQRFDHLIGEDRCRVVYRFSDESIQTQSFDERTEESAKATAAANLPPRGWERPTVVEIYLGRFVALGGTDCEWSDSRLLSVGCPTANGGIDWVHEPDSISAPASTDQLHFFGGSAA